MATRAQSLFDAYGYAYVPAGKRIGMWVATTVVTAAASLTRAMKEQGYRRARRELSMLDDRLLRDMGVSRSEIDFVVRNGR